MLGLGHESSVTIPTHPCCAHAQGRARRTRGRRPRAGAARSRLRAHPHDLWIATFSAAARELWNAAPHHSRAAVIARYRGEALETAETTVPAADAAPFPRARRRHAHELRFHAAEDRLCPWARARDPGG